MILDIFVDFRRDERHAFDAFEQHEVEDGCRGDTPEYSYLPLEVLLVGECEDKTGDVLQDDSEEERYGDGNEYGHDHAERLLRVHQVAYRQSGSPASEARMPWCLQAAQTQGKPWSRSAVRGC